VKSVSEIFKLIREAMFEIALPSSVQLNV